MSAYTYWHAPTRVPDMDIDFDSKTEWLARTFRTLFPSMIPDGRPIAQLAEQVLRALKLINHNLSRGLDNANRTGTSDPNGYHFKMGRYTMGIRVLEAWLASVEMQEFREDVVRMPELWGFLEDD